MEARELAVGLIGTTLDDRYRIVGSLGKGGMGHVYAAVHMTLEQRVAIKVLHPHFAEVERHRARFLQEARAASRIHHPNVVEIKDFGRTPSGTVYFVMEHLHGHDMSVELRRHRRLPWGRVRSILLQAASALRAAHAKQIIHRDIKPANCFLLDDEDTGVRDVVKLLDFGIAKVDSDPHPHAPRRSVTGTSEVLGTASYMSPEQARGEPLDARSDVYSLGVMAYELLTGQVPFKGNNVLRLIAAHLDEPPEPLRNVAPRVPEAVEAVVLTMLAKAPADRYESMRALAHALRAIPETAGKRATKPWCPVVPERRPQAESVPQAPQVRGSLPVGARKRVRIGMPTRASASGTASSTELAEWSGVHRLTREEPSGPSATALMAMAPGASATRPVSFRPTRAARIPGRLALLGLLGLLLGGGSVLVTKVLLAEGEARKAPAPTERADERATQPHRAGAEPDADASREP